MNEVSLIELPDLVVEKICSFLTSSEKIWTLSRVCKVLYNLVHRNGRLWNSVELNTKRNLTCKILDEFVWPATTEIHISECFLIDWEPLLLILQRCKRLKVLNLSWIGRPTVLESKEEVPFGFTTTLYLGNLKYLDTIKDAILTNGTGVTRNTGTGGSDTG
ncbi:hypothetical protein AC249_AIPGENE24547 [Exaiptasia diaphana]|nr:hypothetical protein AC249_AIPGENE24547 [Exaiptasia diaphana]